MRGGDQDEAPYEKRLLVVPDLKDAGPQEGSAHRQQTTPSRRPQDRDEGDGFVMRSIMIGRKRWALSWGPFFVSPETRQCASNLHRY